jgi:sugar lactone lactonase YvrE
VATDLHFPNAAVIIDEGRRLVVNETWVGRVTAFDLAEDGTLGNRRVFADLAGRGPDGMCADATGAVWIGCYHSGEIIRVLDGGEITDRFKFDGCGISCDIGGEEDHTLFLTAFVGPEEEVLHFARRSAIYIAEVEVGRPDTR